MPGRVLFVSDTHLRPDGVPGADEHAERFFSFVRDAASQKGAKRIETMYVLGDLFDYWYEPGGRAPAVFASRCESIGRLVADGLRVVVLPGNRDFLLGRGFVAATGAELAAPELTIELGDHHVRLLHGDALMPDCHRYRMWVRLSRGGGFRRFCAGLPETVAQSIARLIRGVSASEKRRSAPRAVCFSRNELESRYARGADTIVAGHFHECVDILAEAPSTSGRLVILSSWDDSRGAHAVWDGDGLRVVR